MYIDCTNVGGLGMTYGSKDIFLSINTSKPYHNYGYMLSRKIYQRLSTPERPCIDDPDYEITQCFHEYIENKLLSCRLPWHYNSNSSLSTCSSKGTPNL